MKSFFKIVFASMLGFILSGIVLLILFISVLVGMVSSSDSKKVSVEPKSVLHVTLNNTVKERGSKSPLESLDFGGLQGEKTIGLNDIRTALKRAAKDDNIKGIYLDISSVSTGTATLEDIRNALLEFKASKKFIIAYSETYTQGAYYLASVADKIYLNPEGLLEFKGLSTNTMFYKGVLDKLEIEAQVIKVGTFKSAVEPFILNKMSEPNRLQVSSFLGSIYDNFLKNIAKSRSIPIDSLRSIANGLKAQNAQLAVKYKLADALKYKDEIIDELKTLTGTDKKEDLNSVSLSNYIKNNKDEEGSSSSNRVAVVYASGEIQGGEGDDETIGSERISRAIRKVRNDDKVKALVLRVNSPGGSALASDVIWREVMLTKKVKPVIVSMGDYAASGGYYISCAADSIFAEPNTITGSIGVFGIIPNIQKFLNNKIGITFDGVKTSQFADLGNINRPLTDGERFIIQNEINRIYDTFTKRVAEGRKKTQEYVNSIGQGRVWTGDQALKNGLVDGIGNLNRAIQSAGKKAGLKEYKVVYYPAVKDPFESILKSGEDKVKEQFTKMELGDNYKYYKQLKNALSNTGIVARMPFDIEIK